MRAVFALLAVLGACGGKKEPAKQAPGSGSAGSQVAVTADAASIDAAAGPVELLHHYPSFIEVSSHVMNKTIKPEHLVDKDFNTAWNSRTGELAGAWLDVYVPYSTITELRLTVGHTGKGPKGEDYFTMNPRITKVTILDRGKEVVTVALDPEKRELQSIKLPAPIVDHSIRIRIDDVVMGTKKTWKEACVSELEAWGVPGSQAFARDATPLVSVYTPPPPPKPEFEHGKPVDMVAMCDALTKPLQKAYDERTRNSHDIYETEDAPPQCGIDTPTAIDTGPWKQITVWKMMDNAAHGPGACDLVATTDAGDFVLGDERGCGPWDEQNLVLETVETADAVPGDPVELIVTYRPLRSQDGALDLLICRAATDTVQCTKPFRIEDAGWKVKPRFAKGMLILDPVEGKPPTESTGPQSLTFD